MNEAHVHLLINHWPIITPIVGIVVLIVGMIMRSELVKRVAYFIFIAAALLTVVASLSGESAEEVVEKIDGISEIYIEAHEKAASLFSVMMYILGGISLVALWASWKEKTFARIMSYIVVVFAVVAIYFSVETGTSGGEIRHTEIRSGTSANIDASSQPEDDLD